MNAWKDVQEAGLSLTSSDETILRTPPSKCTWIDTCAHFKDFQIKLPSNIFLW